MIRTRCVPSRLRGKQERSDVDLRAPISATECPTFVNISMLENAPLPSPEFNRIFPLLGTLFVMATTIELESLPHISRDPTHDEPTRGGERDHHPNQNSTSQEFSNRQTLEPADGGPSAWKVLLAAWTFEAILWGTLPTTKSQPLPTNNPQASPSLSEFSKTITPSFHNSQKILTSPSSVVWLQESPSSELP